MSHGGYDTIAAPTIELLTDTVNARLFESHWECWYPVGGPTWDDKTKLWVQVITNRPEWGR